MEKSFLKEEEEEINEELLHPKVLETIEELCSRIPTDIMKSDEHPLYNMVEKADDCTEDLADAIESLNLVLRQSVNSVNIFPQKNVNIAEIEMHRAHFDAKYQNDE